jgi:hypothetical protein
MSKLTAAQATILRLCDSPLGFIADDMSGQERASTVRLAAQGLISIIGGKRAYITPSGRALLSSTKEQSNG